MVLVANPPGMDYFNPRSRKGFDEVPIVTVSQLDISIHEAAKASTASSRIPVITMHISIHEAAKASTDKNAYNYLYHNFNPRSRKGFDILEIPTTLMDLDFNPRSRKGFDGQITGGVQGATYFNPRSRKGFDWVCLTKLFLFADFNPRSRKGFDQSMVSGVQDSTKFQSTKPQRLRR